MRCTDQLRSLYLTSHTQRRDYRRGAHCNINAKTIYRPALLVTVYSLTFKVQEKVPSIVVNIPCENLDQIPHPDLSET